MKTDLIQKLAELPKMQSHEEATYVSVQAAGKLKRLRMNCATSRFLQNGGGVLGVVQYPQKRYYNDMDTTTVKYTAIPTVWQTVEWIRKWFNYEIRVIHNPNSQGDKGMWEYLVTPIYEKGYVVNSYDTPHRKGCGCGYATPEDAYAEGIDAFIGLLDEKTYNTSEKEIQYLKFERTEEDNMGGTLRNWKLKTELRDGESYYLTKEHYKEVFSPFYPMMKVTFDLVMQKEGFDTECECIENGDSIVTVKSRKVM